jgi:hypothetical protein
VRDLERALADIHSIRAQVARGVEFRGYGPSTLFATGLLAMLASVAQARWIPDPATHVGDYLLLWVLAAVAAVAVIATETVHRSRRVHSGLAQEMVRAAAEQFLPAGLAGALLTIVLPRYAPDTVWMLPGLWQVVFSVGVFGSCRFLPRPMLVVGAWYLACGMACLALGQGPHALAPWTMGLPFGIGQMLVAGVLQFGGRDRG